MRAITASLALLLLLVAPGCGPSTQDVVYNTCSSDLECSESTPSCTALRIAVSSGSICTNECVDSSQCFSSSGGEQVLSFSWCVGVDAAGNLAPESETRRCVQLCDPERSPPCVEGQECVLTTYDGIEQSFCVPMSQ